MDAEVGGDDVDRLVVVEGSRTDIFLEELLDMVGFVLLMIMIAVASWDRLVAVVYVAVVVVVAAVVLAVDFEKRSFEIAV